MMELETNQQLIFSDCSQEKAFLIKEEENGNDYPMIFLRILIVQMHFYVSDLNILFSKFSAQYLFIGIVYKTFKTLVLHITPLGKSSVLLMLQNVFWNCYVDLKNRIFQVIDKSRHLGFTIFDHLHYILPIKLLCLDTLMYRQPFLLSSYPFLKTRT